MKHVKPGQVVCIVIAVAVVLLTTVGEQTARAATIPPQIHCGGWTIVPSPNATDYQNQLNAVAAVSASDVWAVGYDVAIGGPIQTLIEHWDGTRWTAVPSPNPGGGVNDYLYAAVALSTSNVWAVGWASTQPLIEHWNGSSWQSVTSPSVNGALDGISAQSATDIWAVGSQGTGDTLTEHWDGSAWHIVPAPGVPNQSSELNGVSVLSATDAWAVGNYIGHGSHAEPYSLSEHWDGSAWHIVPTPNVGKFSPLNAVVALSSSNVWAVGNVVDSSLNEHWDGTKWHVVSPSLNGQTYSVVAVSASDIWAVGGALVHFTQPTFIEQWNGTQWQHVRSPNVTDTTISPPSENIANDLLGVSASSAHDIWAVGYYAPEGEPNTYTLIEHYC